MKKRKIDKEATIWSILSKQSLGISVDEAKLKKCARKRGGEKLLIDCAKEVRAPVVHKGGETYYPQ